jgi:hypothetical protein
MVTVRPRSTTRTGPGRVAGAAEVDAKPQIGTGLARPGSTSVPVFAHRSQVAAVPDRVQPVCGSGPCGGPGGPAGTAAGSAAGGAPGKPAGAGCAAAGVATTVTGVATASAAAAASTARRAAERVIVAIPSGLTSSGNRRAGRCG